jgi:hypothetical protein
VSALYDWRNTSADGLSVAVWVNNSDVGGGEAVGAHPPSVQRWAQPVNLAGGGGGYYVGGCLPVESVQREATRELLLHSVFACRRYPRHPPPHPTPPHTPTPTHTHTPCHPRIHTPLPAHPPTPPHPRRSQRLHQAPAGPGPLGSAGGGEGHASGRLPPLPGLLLPAGAPLLHVAAAGVGGWVGACVGAVWLQLRRGLCQHPEARPSKPAGGRCWCLQRLHGRPLCGASWGQRWDCCGCWWSMQCPPFAPLLQLMLPVGVHTLVAEKEQHLRVMMRMQVGPLRTASQAARPAAPFVATSPGLCGRRCQRTPLHPTFRTSSQSSALSAKRASKQDAAAAHRPMFSRRPLGFQPHRPHPAHPPALPPPCRAFGTPLSTSSSGPGISSSTSPSWLCSAPLAASSAFAPSQPTATRCRSGG